MFLTPEQTGGPRIFSLRRHNFYLAVESSPTWRVQEFDIRQLARMLGQTEGRTWRGHTQVILLACMDGKLFEWLNIKEE